MTTSRSESMNAVVKSELMNNGASFMNLLAATGRIEKRWSRGRQEADLDGDGLIAHGAQICPALAHLTRGRNGAAAMLVTNLNSARKWRCGWLDATKTRARVTRVGGCVDRVGRAWATCQVSAKIGMADVLIERQGSYWQCTGLLCKETPLPCEHMCCFLRGQVSLADCHPRYYRAAAGGSLDDLLGGWGTWTGVRDAGACRPNPEIPEASALPAEGAIGAEVVRVAAGMKQKLPKPTKSMRTASGPKSDSTPGLKAEFEEILATLRRAPKSRLPFLMDLTRSNLEAVHDKLRQEVDGGSQAPPRARGGAQAVQDMLEVRGSSRMHHAGEKRGGGLVVEPASKVRISSAGGAVVVRKGP